MVVNSTAFKAMPGKEDSMEMPADQSQEMM
jgi:hypothetical protein